MMRTICRRLERRRSGDDGFTVLEMVVALMMIALAMTALAMLYISVAGTAQLARERQEATTIANQALEEMRALPYTTVTSGLVNCGTELSSDPNISAGHFKPAYNSAINEVLQYYTPSSCSPAPSSTAPLYPHVTTVALGKVTFTKRAYVSQVTGTSPQAYWLTSIVSWSSAATKNKLKTIALRSELFSPSGCLSTSTHPFSGPCQAFLYGNAGVSGGSITLAGVNGAVFLSGLSATGATLSLPELSDGMQIEQTTSMSGKAITSGGSISTSSGTSTSGSVAAVTLADTDPSTSGTGTSTASLSQSGSPLILSGSSNSQLTVSPTSADTGGLVGTVSSTSSPACKDVDGTTTISTTQPCASGNVQALGASGGSIVLGMGQQMDRNFPAMTVASVGAAPSPSYAMTSRFVAANTTYCPTATGAGCAASAAKRSLGNVVLGGVPSGGASDTITSAGTASVLPVSNFSGLVKLSGYSDSAVASNGVGAGTSSVSRSGTLSYWDPANCSATANYCSVSLSTAGASASPSATAHYMLADGSTLDIAMAATVTVASAAPTTSGTTPCQSAACITQSAVSPMTVNLSYTITHGATTIGAFTVAVDLGRVIAKSTYRAAPNG